MTEEKIKEKTKGKTLKEKVDILYTEEQKKRKKNEKKFKIPSIAKVSKKKMMKGYATIVTFHDNKNIEFVKQKIVDGTIKLDKDTISIHAVDSKDIFFFKGKPVILQAKKRLNPFNPLEKENETYGQKYVMARMEGDKLVVKKKFGSIGWIIAAIIGAIIVYSLFTGGA